MEKKLDLSIALATYNEGENLERCLASVDGWAREIVVVDGGSTDKTLEIAKKYHAKIIRTDNPSIFHLNKQKALEACTSEWILQLDADEMVTSGLACEIRDVLSMSDTEINDRRVDPAKARLFERHQEIVERRDGRIGTSEGSFTAFFLPRRNFFLGHAMIYSGTYPDGVIRLVQKGKARFPAKSVHEQIQIVGKVGWLHHDLLHFSNPTLKKYFSGADKYTSLLAKDLKTSNRNGLILFFDYIWWKPLITFWSLFLRHKGFLDGWYGFLFDLLSAVHYPTAYLKYSGLVNLK